MQAPRLRHVAPRRYLAFCGRLAQLVERLLYTQDVGGSSPSPPTTQQMSAFGCEADITFYSANVRFRPRADTSRVPLSQWYGVSLYVARNDLTEPIQSLYRTACGISVVVR